MTTTYTLKVADVTVFREGQSYRTFVAGVLDSGTFEVVTVDEPSSRIKVQTSDGWVPLTGRDITYDTDTLLPGNSFQLEAVTLRVGVKTGMDKLPENRRIG